MRSKLRSKAVRARGGRGGGRPRSHSAAADCGAGRADGGVLEIRNSRSCRNLMNLPSPWLPASQPGEWPKIFGQECEAAGRLALRRRQRLNGPACAERKPQFCFYFWPCSCTVHFWPSATAGRPAAAGVPSPCNRCGEARQASQRLLGAPVTGVARVSNIQIVYIFNTQTAYIAAFARRTRSRSSFAPARPERAPSPCGPPRWGPPCGPGPAPLL